MVLFPLTWKQIQTTVAMRRLKPELDTINEKFKDDAQAKGLATMELWRKHKISPSGAACPRSLNAHLVCALHDTANRR